MSPLPQPVNAPLTRAALFLVATINPGADPCAGCGSICGDLASLVRAVGFRAADAGLSCVMGIGRDAWDRLFGQPRPVQLHSFREIRAAGRFMPSPRQAICFSTFAHEQFDLCFELGTQIADASPAMLFQAGGRGAWFSFLRRPRSPGVCRWDREPNRPGREGRHASSSKAE